MTDVNITQVEHVSYRERTLIYGKIGPVRVYTKQNTSMSWR